jgi:hypothetical protein
MTCIRVEEAIVTNQIVAALLGVGLMSVAAAPASMQSATGTQAGNQISGKIRLTALAVDMSNMATGKTATVDFVVNRWSSESQREMLIQTMIDKGQDELLKELQRQPSLGRMSFPAWQGRDPLNARLGWDIRYAHQNPLDDGGTRIVLALDRYIGFWEAANRPRSIDYPFTFIEIRLDKNGEGEGKMSIATRVNFDKKKNQIELETYASEPVRLQGVRLTSRT